jgi:hypothetical protein
MSLIIIFKIFLNKGRRYCLNLNVFSGQKFEWMVSTKRNMHINHFNENYLTFNWNILIIKMQLSLNIILAIANNLLMFSMY